MLWQSKLERFTWQAFLAQECNILKVLHSGMILPCTKTLD